MDLVECIKTQFPNAEGKTKENFSIIKASKQGIFLKLKPNAYIDQGFENFAIVESSRKLKIQDLISLDDDKLQPTYNKNIENDIGEFFVHTMPDSKKCIIRTVIHCLEEHLVEMFSEISEVHVKIHLASLGELGL
jgi:archaellum biogenesis ATPase FlaH